MLSEYRNRFSEFHTEIHRDNYLVRSGQKSRSERRSIMSEHSDLFMSEKIAELKSALKEISPGRQNDRAAVRRLIAFASGGNLARAAEELAEEIRRYEMNARIDWRGESRAIPAALTLLGDESDAALRRDLFARIDNALQTIDDLRAERMALIRESVLRLGYQDSVKLVGELFDLDLARLTASADKILSKTESVYLNALSPLVPVQTGLGLDQATEADLQRFLRFTRFDHFFEGELLLKSYRELFAAFGFKTEKQTNLTLDLAVRPQKQIDAFCSPIEVPEEIILSFTVRGGQANFRGLFREAGYAQHFAWTSQNSLPEFRRSGAFDVLGGQTALRLAWGLLLQNLFLDESYLMSSAGFAENRTFRRTLAVFRLMAVRRTAALVRYDAEFHAEQKLVNPGGRYVELVSDAVRFRTSESGRLRETARPFRAADVFRACAFESQMREYLKTKYGQRWWASTKAGDALIDLWNTGERYSIEELAAIIGLGELDFDWLASELQTQTTELA